MGIQDYKKTDLTDLLFVKPETLIIFLLHYGSILKFIMCL